MRTNNLKIGQIVEKNGTNYIVLNFITDSTELLGEFHYNNNGDVIVEKFWWNMLDKGGMWELDNQTLDKLLNK